MSQLHPRTERITLAAFVAIVAGFVVASKFGVSWARVANGGPTMVWPASAVALYAAFRYGRGALGAIAMGSVVIALWQGRTAGAAALGTAAPLAEATIGLLLLRRVRFDGSFMRIGDGVRLAIVAGVAALVGGVLGVSVRNLSGHPAGMDGVAAMAQWALGDGVGMLTYAPALFLLFGIRGPVRRPARLELVALTLATVAIVGLVLLEYRIPTESHVVAMWVTLFPVLLWTSVRAELRVAAVVVAVLSLAGTIGAHRGLGALADSSSLAQITNVQAFHVMMVMMVVVGASATSALRTSLDQSQATERKLALVFEGTSDAQSLYEVGKDNVLRLTMANTLWLDAMKAWRPGLTDSDLLGKTIDELRVLVQRPERDAQAYSNHMRRTIESGAQLTYEEDAETPYGVRTLETTMVPVLEGGTIRYLLASVRDQTQARESARLLRASAVRFAAVSDAIDDVQLLFAVESGGFRLEHMNRAAREVIRRSYPHIDVDTFLGKFDWYLFEKLPPFTEEKISRNRALAAQTVATKQNHRFVDEFETPVGARIVSVTFVPIVNDQGTVTHLLRSSVDITDSKKLEAAARQFNEDLEKRVNERTAQLAMANRELESFAYSLSHDLKAPLRSVEGFSRALLEDLQHHETQHIADYAGRINAAALRMKTLVDDLLRLSQISTEDVARRPLDLTALTHDIVREVSAECPQRVVDISVQPGMYATADARLVAIAMRNLLDNAFKYTARRIDSRIEVGQRNGDVETVTFVRDNGIGFDPRYASRLFAPFQRLHKADEFEGVGIGLATVHRVIAAHGGRVWAESAPNEGATFFFTLGGG